MEVVLQSGHPLDAYTVAFTPDGRYLATGGGERSDAAVRIWDVSVRKEVRVLPQPYAVDHIGISPDGTMLEAIGGLFEIETGRRVHGADSTEAFWDGRVEPWFPAPDWSRVVALEWDQERGKGGLRVMSFPGEEVLTRIDLGESRAFRVWFARDAARIAVGVRRPGGKERGILVLDSSTGARIADRSEDPDFVRLSPDGRYLLVAKEGKHLRMVDLERPEEPLWQLDSIPAKSISLPTGTDFLGDGSELLVGDSGGNALLLLDTRTGETRRRFVAPDPLLGLAVDAAGGRLAGSFGKKWGGPSDSGEPHGIRLWDLATGEVLKDLRDDSPKAYASLDFTPDGRYLASAGFDLDPVLWDVAEGRRDWRMTGRVVEPDTLAFHPGDRHLAILGTDSRLRVMDLATARVTAVVQNCWDVDWDPRGRWLGILPARGRNSKDGALLLWDPEQGRVERVLEVPQFKPTAFTFDPQGARVAAAGWYGGQVVVWDSARSEPLWKGSIASPSHVAFSPDGRLLAGSSMSTDAAMSGVVVWNAADGAVVAELEGSDVRASAFSPDGRWLAVAENSGATPRVLVYDTATWSQVGESGGHDWIVSEVCFSSDSQHIFSADMSGRLVLRERASGRLVRSVAAHGFKVTDLELGPTGSTLATSSKDGRTVLWDARDLRELATVVVGSGEDAVLMTPEGHYTMSPEAHHLVAFADGMRTYPFEQFDLRLNRPDLVVRRLGRASSEVVELYERAWTRRVRRMGFTPAQLSEDAGLPTLTLLEREALPVSQVGRRLAVRVRATSESPLERLNLFVNDVPVWGTQGRSIPGGPREHEHTVELELSAGRNKIQLSCHNEAGLESLRSTFEVTCSAPAGAPDAYVLAIGVSAYRQREYSLAYAAKDAADLVAAFEENELFDEVHSLLLTDEEAVAESILAGREFLARAGVDDQVLLFVAGHGVLSEDLEYYFGTHDIDFADPAGRGLSYAQLEGLVDGLRARKKLVLMDTCHSGELEEESATLVADSTPAGVTRRATRGLRVVQDSSTEELSELLESLFTDLRRGTGAVVLTSSSGTEFSYEDERWANGVFSYALLEGLREGRAGEPGTPIRASDLMAYVASRVTELTGGLQTPTLRRGNLEQDFPIWR